jgi:hypothetical protein
MAATTASTQTRETLLEEGGLTLYRSAASTDGSSSMLAWVVDDGHADERLRFERELALRDVLDELWAARPIELVAQRHSLTLLLSDPGGEPLSCRIGPP